MGGAGRMNPDGASVHETRKRLLFYIAENPGATFQTLKRVFRINDGTLRYHLDYLRRKKKIRQIKKDNRRTYVPSELRMDLHAPTSRRRELSREQKRLLDLIILDPGISRSELLDRSREPRKQLSYNLNRLNELGFIWKARSGGRTGYAPITSKELYRQAYAVIVDRLLDEEIDIDTYRELKRKLDLMIEEE
jgi:predicted transcriptional regulator